ncbi:hypothetical protein ACIPLR_03185 [Herbaspirillum huttiense]|jgi:hypothetical protein|uniref:hypothetical protein n=1 Tax=Herbaspirillum huttiense TaxID=863372 RepID=UPI0038132A38
MKFVSRSGEICKFMVIFAIWISPGSTTMLELDAYLREAKQNNEKKILASAVDWIAIGQKSLKTLASIECGVMYFKYRGLIVCCPIGTGYGHPIHQRARKT